MAVTHAASTCVDNALKAQRKNSPITNLRDIYCTQCTILKCKQNSNLLKLLPLDRFALTELDLNLNFVGRNGVKAVLEVAQAAPNLQKLYIADNFLSNDCIRHLTKSLETHPSLHFLDLSRNPISHVSGKALNELVTTNGNIFAIALKDTLINPALVKQINKKGQNNRVEWERKNARRYAADQLAEIQPAAPVPAAVDEHSDNNKAFSKSTSSAFSDQVGGSSTNSNTGMQASYNLSCLMEASSRLQNNDNASTSFSLLQEHIQPYAKKTEGKEKQEENSNRPQPLLNVGNLNAEDLTNSPSSNSSRFNMHPSPSYSDDSSVEEVPKLGMVFRLMGDLESPQLGSFPALHKLEKASLSPRKGATQEDNQHSESAPNDSSPQQRGQKTVPLREEATAVAAPMVESNNVVSAAPPQVPPLGQQRRVVDETKETFNACDLLFQTLEPDVENEDDDAFLPLRLVCDVARRHANLNTKLAPVMIKSPRSTTTDSPQPSPRISQSSGESTDNVGSTEMAVAAPVVMEPQNAPVSATAPAPSMNALTAGSSSVITPDKQQWYGMSLIWHYVRNAMEGGSGVPASAANNNATFPPSPSKGWSALTTVVKVINMGNGDGDSSTPTNNKQK